MSLLLFFTGCGGVPKLHAPPPEKRGGGGTPASGGCGPLIKSASWGDGRLTVVPTTCGRRLAFSRVDLAFRQAITLGGRGAPNRRSLRRQLLCHAVFAPLKPAWHLEKWRPYVSWATMIRDRCNPPAA